MTDFLSNIISQAYNGNFSAFILAVNVAALRVCLATLVYMVWKDRRGNK